MAVPVMRWIGEQIERSVHMITTKLVRSYLRHSKSGLSEKSSMAYRKVLYRFLESCKPGDNGWRESYKQWLSKVSLKTQVVYVSVVGQFIEWCEKHGHLTPVVEAPAPEPQATT
jgi:predicted phosphoadenosine phosphosulfate sulfurtransferase